jgi:protein SMG6
MMYSLLNISLGPNVPPSLRDIPKKYKIITRLWTHGFYRLLETLRRAACGPPRDALAFEHLQDVLYFAYSFYCALSEEHALDEFRESWLEALGDLARYNMTIAAMAQTIYYAPSALTASAMSQLAPSRGGSPAPAPAPATPDAPMSDAGASVENGHESPVPSIGVAAARALELEPDKERWRKIARGWYAAGVANTPGAGKLHHHLGLLSRELEEEELRGMYHFCKRSVALL